MSTEKEHEIHGWYSTYGLITAQRILEGYNIKLPPNDLLKALNTPDSFYHRLLKLPLKNIYNGIILQQAKDYQIYLQKLFIDYLLSGESNKPPESPGYAIREELEEKRSELVELNNQFHETERKHESIIAHSQVALKISAEKVLHLDEREKMEYLSKTEADLQKYKSEIHDISSELRHYRIKFHGVIIQTMELLRALPEYTISPQKLSENQEAIQFDGALGE